VDAGGIIYACAWCGLEMNGDGTTTGRVPADTELVSHGICAKCRERF
jgi:hypothetical protein